MRDRATALRAPEANRTTLTRIRDGSSPWAMASNQASPVNVSAGALTLGSFGLISNFLLLPIVMFPFQGTCPGPAGECLLFRVLTGPLSAARAERTVVVMDNRNEIRDFLVSRRARITPEQVGLPGATEGA